MVPCYHLCLFSALLQLTLVRAAELCTSITFQPFSLSQSPIPPFVFILQFNIRVLNGVWTREFQKDTQPNVFVVNPSITILTCCTLGDLGYKMGFCIRPPRFSRLSHFLSVC